ncbi:MAG: hypothetical protein ACM3UZ_08110 [Acidobacteriota bacterium]
MVNNKDSVVQIILRNHDVYERVGIYNIANGEFEEKLRSDLPDLKETWRGFYITNEKDILGLFASVQGPVFFVNNKMYLLSEKEWSFKIDALSDSKNIFHFYYGGIEEYSSSYTKPTDLSVHAYADEEFMDFYQWLLTKKDSKTFVSFYTV